MPLPFLIVGALAAGSMALARLRDARGITDPHNPDGEKLPTVWGPGQAPDKYWVADHDLPNANDCGWHGENGDAHLARWLNHKKGVPLPGDIQTWHIDKLAKWLSSFVLGGLSHLGDPKQILASLEADTMLYTCLSQKLIGAISRAPGKAGEWIKQTAAGAAAGISDAVDNATSGTSVTVGGGEAHASVGGHKLF